MSRRQAVMGGIVLGCLVAVPRAAAAEPSVEDPTFVDPRKRQLPPTH